MPTKDSGIYIAINLDIDPFTTNLNIAKSQSVVAGKSISDALNKSVNVNQAIKDVGKLTDSIAVLARAPKSVNFTPTINGLVLLLCGGDKGSQRQDIDSAVNFFNDYSARKNL